eukprot:1141730-Pelagomonas_calceolata.AAC.3
MITISTIKDPTQCRSHHQLRAVKLDAVDPIESTQRTSPPLRARVSYTHGLHTPASGPADPEHAVDPIHACDEVDASTS